MRVLITGADGQLGRDLVTAFSQPHHEVLAATHQMLDVSDREAVLGALVEFCPDAVLHAGAWTDVDGCETDPDRALRVNALGTRHVAEGARLVGARVCYLSTDYVFDGRTSRPYDEWAPTAPLSVYGRSKLAGEHEVSPGDTVVRTSWVCSPRGRNFVLTMLRLAAQSTEVTVVDDQHGCPTFTLDLAGAIHRLVVARMPGVFHVTNQGPTTWFEFARAIFECAGQDPSRVVPISTSELRPIRPAPRPMYSVLDNTALRLVGLPPLPHWRDTLERVVKEAMS